VIRPKDVIEQIDKNTRFVALASCHFISGYRIDFQAIGKTLRERNILFCLDAIQTVGAFPTTIENVDMLAAMRTNGCWDLAALANVRAAFHSGKAHPAHLWLE